MSEYLFILIIAAVVTYLLTPLVRRGAIAMHAQHAPRARDVHKEPTPLLGGVAMYGGLVAGLLVADRLSYLRQAFPSSRTVDGLLLAGGLLVVVGIVDDRWGLGAISKLAAQIAAGGIVVWSGAYLPWIPWPGSETVLLEPDLSYTVTILIIVATINAVNFIDGLDGLAAGVVGISAVAYLIYSYELTNSVGIPSQSVPAVASAVLAGMCIGFLPHNFNPARIFMGDTGSMLLGLMLAYGPISSTASLDQNLLVNYAASCHPVNRFPTILPLIIPVAIWIIPYTDMLLAVVRRTMKGMSPFDADRQHLHHRLQNMGHSHRQSVLLMYLWAALFSGLVVGLSVLRISLIWFAVITLAPSGPCCSRRRRSSARGAPRAAVSGSGPEEAAPVLMTRSPLPRTSPHRSAGRYPAYCRLRPFAQANGMAPLNNGPSQRHAAATARTRSGRRRAAGHAARSRRRRPRRPGHAAPDRATRPGNIPSRFVRTGACPASCLTAARHGQDWRSVV